MPSSENVTMASTVNSFDVVRSDIPRYRYLYFQDVTGEMHEDGPGVFIPQDKPTETSALFVKATQSSTCHYRAASSAINNDDGDFSHTCEDDVPNAWWMVELHQAQTIPGVTIINRGDGQYQDRIEGSEVEVLDSEMNVIASEEVLGVSSSYDIAFGENIQGRYIRIIQRSKSAPLNIGEVRLSGQTEWQYPLPNEFLFLADHRCSEANSRADSVALFCAGSCIRKGEGRRMIYALVDFLSLMLIISFFLDVKFLSRAIAQGTSL